MWHTQKSPVSRIQTHKARNDGIDGATNSFHQLSLRLKIATRSKVARRRTTKSENKKWWIKLTGRRRELWRMQSIKLDEMTAASVADICITRKINRRYLSLSLFISLSTHTSAHSVAGDDRTEQHWQLRWMYWSKMSKKSFSVTETITWIWLKIWGMAGGYRMAQRFSARRYSGDEDMGSMQNDVRDLICQPNFVFFNFIFLIQIHSCFMVIHSK